MVRVKYGKYWDLHYHRTYQQAGEKSPWDVDPQLAAESDIPVFKDFFDSKLPLVDLGCGTGNQSAFLGKYFNMVVGLDASAEAIAIAKKRYSRDQCLQFEVFDATDKKQAEKFHRKFGDVNVYMRGVLHQIRTEDQREFLDVLRLLMGRTGVMYLVEVSQAINELLTENNPLPGPLSHALAASLKPTGISIKSLTDLFPNDQFTILKSDNTSLVTNIKNQDGQSIEIPAIYALIAIDHNPY